MPLAWPAWRRPRRPRRASLPSLPVALLLAWLLAGPDRAAADHHHHHHPPRGQSLVQGLLRGRLGAGHGRSQAVSPITLLNPWLSACDLVDPAVSPDLQGLCTNAMPSPRTTKGHGPFTRVNGDISEGPGPPKGPNSLAKGPNEPRLPGVPPGPATDEACPLSCAAHNVSHTECLHYFHETDKDRLCAGSLTKDRLAEFRLLHCCEHSVLHSLPPEALKAVLSSSAQCNHFLGALLDLDVLAARLSCEFSEILQRFDCDHQYSVTHMCTHCQVSRPDRPRSRC